MDILFILDISPQLLLVPVQAEGGLSLQWWEARAKSSWPPVLLVSCWSGVHVGHTSVSGCRVWSYTSNPHRGTLLFDCLFSVITCEISPCLCIYVGVLLIYFVPFSPRPPCLPPKPQKMRRPRPLSVYNHKLFNGNMETFIKVLAGLQ